MSGFRASYNHQGMDSLINAARKILSGERDQETADAGTEDRHPIVKAQQAAPQKEETQLQERGEGIPGKYPERRTQNKAVDTERRSGTDRRTADKGRDARKESTELGDDDLQELDTKSYTIDAKGTKGKLVKRLDDGQVEVNIEGQGNVKMSATTWSSKLRKYATETFQPQGDMVSAATVSHQEFGDGQVLPGTQVMEGDEIVACDVMFGTDIKREVPVYELTEKCSDKKVHFTLKKKMKEEENATEEEEHHDRQQVQQHRIDD